jgi:hypothetical protein
MVAASFFTLVLDTARDAFNLLLAVGAGTGLLYLLRWFWWRINAWSEIAAMASSFVLAVGLFVAGRSGVTLPTHQTLVVTVAATTLVWLVTTWLTSPTDPGTLRRFYALARPAGPGWAAFRGEAPDAGAASGFGPAFLAWASGCVTVYAALFGTGYLLLGQAAAAGWAALLSAAGGVVLAITIGRLWRT